MSKLRPRKKQKKIIESDGDNGSDDDMDWVPGQEEQEQEGGGEVQTPENNTSASEIHEFDTTEGFQLKAVKSMKNSNHLIWTMFGSLMRNDKIVEIRRNYLYCIRCFNNKKFKW